MEHSRHDYLSDACYHAEHHDCGTSAGRPAAEGGAREPSSCSYCGARCRCACHPAPLTPVTREDFIAKITAARKTRRLTQAQLGSLVGVGQQAISGWENGAPPPSGATLQLLCAALGLQPELDREFDEPLTLPPLDTLPLRILTVAQFAAFTTDLFAALYPTARIDTPARHGDIDLSLHTHSGERLGVKCVPGRFLPSSFDKARAETDLDASGVDRCLLLLRTSASEKVRAHAADAHPVWEIWDAHAIAERLRSLEPATALRLIERHFPGLGAAFLGIEP